MSVNFKPVGDRILVKPTPPKNKTENGILIPDNAKDKSAEGIVVACGEVEDLKVGDEILFSQYAGSEITLSNVTYLIMRESDVEGII